MQPVRAAAAAAVSGFINVHMTEFHRQRQFKEPGISFKFFFSFVAKQLLNK